MPLQEVVDFLVGVSSYTGSAQDDQVNIRQLMLNQTKTITNQALYSVSIYRPTNTLFGYGQPKPGLSHIVFTPEDSEAGISGFFRF